MIDKHILITGSDLVGKTTLIDMLQQEFGDNCAQSKGPLVKTPIVDYANKLMNRNPRPKDDDSIFGMDYNLFVNSLLLTSYIIDSNFYTRKYESKIHLQDSYFERTMAVIDSRGVPYLNSMFDKVKCKLFAFDVSILLTADIKTRAERLRNRGGDDMDEVIIANPDEVLAIERFLMTKVDYCKNHMVIDNSNLTKEETLEVAKHHIINSV
ncbi:MAG: hypothetical protein ABIB71_05920 [Candidatus Woesearchaeota archaeon]